VNADATGWPPTISISLVWTPTRTRIPSSATPGSMSAAARTALNRAESASQGHDLIRPAGPSRALVRLGVHSPTIPVEPGGAATVAAVAVAAELTLRAQGVEGTGDFAAVVAAERLDDLGVEHGAGSERLLCGGEAGGARGVIPPNRAAMAARVC
jgi:hypothetical protein